MTRSAILRRIGQAVVVIWATFTLAFLLLAALPGDAVQARYDNPTLGLTQEQLAEIRDVYGADEPLIVRYLNSLFGFLRGDFGYSVATGTPVAEVISEALPSTMALASLAFLLGVVAAVLIAVLASFGPFSWLRGLFRSLPPLMVSLPSFWVGIILIQIFSFQFGLVPVIGASPAQELILPTVTLAIPIAAPLAQVLLRSMDEVMAQPFIQSVRARGASALWLLWHNVLRNAMLPAITMAGILFGELIGGSVVTEAVFGRHGIGAITVDAVTDRDNSVLLAVVVITATAFVLINLLVDLLYPVLDARLRTRGTGEPDRRKTTRKKVSA